MKKLKEKLKLAFEVFSTKITKFTGSSAAFSIALMCIIIWLVSGPVFQFSDTWQLVINTGTTIITFLMVFLIQKSQNKESMAIQLKLNELIAASRLASNRLVNVEGLTEDELNILHNHYRHMAELTKKTSDLHQSHSIEEAIAKTKMKLTSEKPGEKEKKIIS